MSNLTPSPNQWPKHPKVALAFVFLFVAITTPAAGQEPVKVERVEGMVRHVARAVLTEGDSLTAEQVALVKRLTVQLAGDMAFLEAQKQRAEELRQKRNETIVNIASYIAIGIAILVALIALRSAIRAMGRGGNSADAPLGVLIATRTEAQARNLGQLLIAEHLATGGTVAPSTRSIYRRGDDVREASEAMVLLKTTQAQLGELIARADEWAGGKTTELVAIRIQV